MKAKRAARFGVPYKPGLRKLIQDKQEANPTSLKDLKRGFAGWHERGHLPHRDQPGLTQFVTFNLADAFPRALRSEWAALLKIENDRQRRKELEDYLDQGQGAGHLKRPELADIVERAFRFYHPSRCALLAWAVMPNHVHILFRITTTSMTELIAGWKEYTAREINKQLRRKGAFWAGDYWDTYVRNEKHELAARGYIENNPLKAGLVQEPRDWPWSSARFRDPTGVLHL